MSRWRILVVVGLVGVPFLALAGIGSYFLWRQGWGFVAWWPMMLCMAAGYFLGWYWQHKRQLLLPPDFETPTHWTDRDKEAWKLVEARAANVARLPPEKLGEVDFYWQTAREMAQELANFYHPGALDPVGALTVPEILAVVELSAHDLSVLIDQHLPGGHLLTINDWKRAQQLTRWYETANNVYWAVSALFNPIQTGMRYAASQVGMSHPLKMLQQNLFAWFYTAYVHRLGTYLIDLDSGRLRVGATRYRQLVETAKQAALSDAHALEKAAAGPFPADGAPAEDAVDRVKQVTVTLLGQVKAGKSSLINALLGEQRARTGSTPLTDNVERYELVAPGIPTKLTLLDTVGYAHAGPKADQVAATAAAAQQSDLLLLVLHARNPARQADVEMLDALRRWFAARPDLRSPPVIAVLTHIDLLSPAMEWSPPYNWQSPVRPKEVSIREALAAARQQLGDRVASAAPVCTAAGKEYGIEEALMPAVAAMLDEVRGVALLRCLRAEADRDRIRKVFHQMLATGKEAARIAWQLLNQPLGTGS
jgi:small GTP-binding protein